MSDLYNTLIEKADEAGRISRQPDPERDPGGRTDSVNEFGRSVAYGRSEAFREAAELAHGAGGREARLREYEEKLAHYGDAEAISIVRRRSAGT